MSMYLFSKSLGFNIFRKIFSFCRKVDALFLLRNCLVFQLFINNDKIIYPHDIM